METDGICKQLKMAGATEDMLALYKRYVKSNDKQGQERVLCRCRRMKDESLQEEREKLACLDYIIARVEKTQGLFDECTKRNERNQAVFYLLN